MEFRVLGAVEVVAGGRTIAVGGSRERAVLARLLLSANEVVSQERLVDDLWPAEPPDGAAGAVQVYVSRLRKALRAGGGDEVVLTRPPGYLLAVDPGAVDAARFEALVGLARRSAAHGDQAGAAARLSEALDLWRGPAYSGAGDLPFATTEAARLEEARLGALEARIEAELACGCDGDVAAELSALTAAHPLRERFWALRMTALYRAGRQSEALRTYQELRRRLGDELGIEPSEELRALERAILRHDPGLARPQPSGPRLPPVLPLPAALARHDSFFVRPEADMARLEAAWATARSGRRQVVLLAGEPGIGKTRLSAEIARAAQGTGAAVLHGRCDDGLGLPYQPFVEALSTHLRDASAAAPALGRLAGELARIAPDLAARFPGLRPPLSADPETERYRLFEAVAAWLAAAAAEAPTVLVVEDVHWATPPTLAMLAHVVRSAEPGRLLVVVNYRNTALDVTPALADTVADLLRQPGVDRIGLGGLDETGVAAYLATLAGLELDTESRRFAGRLYADTGGNPFYVGEVLRHLGESGALSSRNGRWTATATAGRFDVPESVRDVIARRLARLPHRTAEVLAAAAVQGDGFDIAVLAAATGQDYVTVLHALGPAVGARLVTEADGSAPTARFVHALVRHTVEDGLTAARRLELHRATGAALAALVGDDWEEHAPELARHWLAAIPPVGAPAEELDRTLDYAEEAARRAVAALAPEEAAALLARALPLAARLGDPPRRAALLVALGEAEHDAGEPAHRRTLADAADLALELGDGGLAARAALANQRPVSLMLPADPGRVGLLGRVLDALGPDDSADRARVLVAIASELHHSTDPRRHELAREAVAVARRLGDPDCLGRVLGLAAFALWEPDSLGERLEIATELSDLAGRLSDPVLEVDAGLALYYAAAQHGDVDRARAALSEATRAADEIGRPVLRLRALVGQQSCAMLDGRADDFTRLAAEAFELGETLGVPDRLINYHGDGGILCLLHGRVDEAITGISSVVDTLPGPYRAFFLAWPYAEAGRCSEAAELLAGIGGASLRDVPRTYVRLFVLAFLTPACALLGDRELARRLYDELLPYRTQIVVGQVSTLGPVAHYLGLLAAVLGRPDEAEEHFAAACALAERTGARGILARTRLERARITAR